MNFSAPLQKFLNALHENFGARREELLSMRHERARKFLTGEDLRTLPETEAVRGKDWRVASVPADLEKRTVEITGPAEPKMIINALNSGANVFMADLEDAMSPTWANVQSGHQALREAVRKTLRLEQNGKTYSLNDTTATLVVRPRGLHMAEKHYQVNGQPISASLFDFGVYFFENAQELLDRGTGPYFYLPKLESHLEARWWKEVFAFAEQYVGTPRGKIRSTVLIETAPAAFEMEEILFELKDSIVALNAGRWDYIFSWIKKFATRKEFIFPDRGQVVMTVPFMKAYCEKIVEVCHKRGAHAIGGMSAFIPNRKEPEVTEQALAKVRADKLREVNQGFDGTWVAHPDLIAVARAEFENALGTKPHQKDKRKGSVPADDRLSTIDIDGGKITEEGVRGNLFVTLAYLDHWLLGTGAVSILNLMEDAATAEISRGQIWQWLHHKVVLADGRQLTPDLVKTWMHQESEKAEKAGLLRIPRVSEEALSGLIFNSEFPEFLTIHCERLLRQQEEK